MKTALVILSIIITFAMILGTNYISAYNYGNRAENVIVAEYTNMENILSQYSLEVSEAAQIPAMQTEDLQKIFEGTLAARYGDNGSQASFQWLKEQNPNLDQTSYLKIENIISAGRLKFSNAQTKFIDTKRQYTTNIGYLWKGFWMRTAGYPKINLAEYVIISTEKTKEIFKTKLDDGLKLR